MDRPPERVSLDAASEFYRPDTARIGVRFDGKDRRDVYEYNVPEGWVRVMIYNAQGRVLAERGKPLLRKMPGKVEVYWR